MGLLRINHATAAMAATTIPAHMPAAKTTGT